MSLQNWEGHLIGSLVFFTFHHKSISFYQCDGESCCSAPSDPALPIWNNDDWNRRVLFLPVIHEWCQDCSRVRCHFLAALSFISNFSNRWGSLHFIAFSLTCFVRPQLTLSSRLQIFFCLCYFGVELRRSQRIFTILPCWKKMGCKAFSSCYILHFYYTQQIPLKDKNQ